MYYHYTSITNLALILNSGKFRFSRLDNLDDKLEQKYDTNIIKYKNIFVSSWSKQSKELIPLWQMYGDNMRGVRIGFNDNLFFTKSRAILAPPIASKPIKTRFILSYDELETTEYDIHPICYSNEYLIKEVEYLDSENEFKEKKESIITVRVKPDITEIDFRDIGDLAKYKTIDWKFLNETRFVLYVFPKGIIDYQRNEFLAKHYKIEKLNKKFNQKYIDISMNRNTFKNAEIVIGPKCTNADQIIVDSLIKTNKLANKSIKSFFTNKI